MVYYLCFIVYSLRFSVYSLRFSVYSLCFSVYSLCFSVYRVLIIAIQICNDSRVLGFREKYFYHKYENMCI
jgi:hypothetical protein